MNNVSQLMPTVTEGNDSLGNLFDIHLIGMLPQGLDRLGQMPNLYFFDTTTNFNYFVRLEFKGDLDNTRRLLGKYDFNVIVDMYTELVTLFVRRIGVNIPDTARVSDVGQLLRTFIQTGVTHSFGWLYRGSSRTFIFEVGVLFFHVYEGDAAEHSISVLVNGVRHQCEVMTAITKLHMDPWSVFHMTPTIMHQLEEWFNNAVNSSPYMRVEFKIPR